MADSNETTIIDGPEVLERMAALLEASGKFRILRRLEPRAGYHVPDGTPTRRGIFLDIETTGLDSATDEIVELAMVAFDFTYDGRIFAVHESLSRFRDPGRPIPAAVTALTGITDAMVAGASIDPAEIESFLGPAAARPRSRHRRCQAGLPRDAAARGCLDLADARCGSNAGGSTGSRRQVNGGFRCMPPSLLFRWNASRRLKKGMSGYALSGVIRPFWGLVSRAPSVRRRAIVREMKEGPSGSAIRC